MYPNKLKGDRRNLEFPLSLGLFELFCKLLKIVFFAFFDRLFLAIVKSKFVRAAPPIVLYREILPFTLSFLGSTPCSNEKFDKHIEQYLEVVKIIVYNVRNDKLESLPCVCVCVRLCEMTSIGPTWINATHLASRVAITEYNIMSSNVTEWSASDDRKMMYQMSYNIILSSVTEWSAWDDWKMMYQMSCHATTVVV